MSGKYRRRAVEVEAWQNDDAGPAMPYWLQQLSTRERAGVVHVSVGSSTVAAQLGDYVVLYPDGHVAVMDPGSFGVEFEELRPPRSVAEAIDRGHDVRMGVDFGKPEDRGHG